MKTVEVTLQLSHSKVTVEVVVPEDITEEELLDVAIAEVESELSYCKLDSYI